jgi:hypothetical protein
MMLVANRAGWTPHRRGDCEHSLPSVPPTPMRPFCRLFKPSNESRSPPPANGRGDNRNGPASGATVKRPLIRVALLSAEVILLP